MPITLAEWSVMLLCLSMACAIGGGLYEHIVLTRGYSNKKPEYLVYQEEGMDEAFRVVSDVAGER